MRLRLLVTLILTACLLSCGGGSGTQPAEPTENAQAPVPTKSLSSCSLLTADEVKAIMGAEVKPTESGAASTVSSCTWVTDSGSGLGVMVRQATSAGEAEAVYANAISQSQALSGVAPQDMPGLGDRAYWAGGNLKQLNVFKSNYWVIISVFAPGKDKDPLAIARATAEKAIPRLP